MTVATQIDLDAYFARVGWKTMPANPLAVLQAVLMHHTRSIPFENLDSLIGLAVPLDGSALTEKLLKSRRGGYCFEHNMLLWNVLMQLGFKVSGLAARVRWNVPDNMITPIGHMALRVDLDEQAYLVDAGFGGITLTAPLQLDNDATQRTSHEPFRIAHHGEQRTLQVQLDEQWRSMYTFELTEFLPVDYQVWNWFTHTSPVSPFTSQLMLAHPDQKGRHALRNNVYSYHSLSGGHEQRTLTSVAELREVLQTRFGIDAPYSSALDGKLATIIAASHST
jgi:N-hydroxyarylamine O-acetyltransferase